MTRDNTIRFPSERTLSAWGRAHGTDARITTARGTRVIHLPDYLPEAPRKRWDGGGEAA